MKCAIGGPLLRIKWKGALLPCFEKVDDKSARCALRELSNAKVKWHRKGIGGGALTSWFGSASKSSKDAVDAVLVWVDTRKGPVLQIHALGADGKKVSRSSPKQSAGDTSRAVPLSKIDKVKVQERAVILQTDKGGDLLCIEFVSKDATAIKDCFVLLVEWDGRRLMGQQRPAIPEQDREMGDASMSRGPTKRGVDKTAQPTKRAREKIGTAKEVTLPVVKDGAGGKTYVQKSSPVNKGRRRPVSSPNSITASSSAYIQLV